MGLLLLLVLGILAGGYLVLFSYGNPQEVSLNLLGNWYLHDVAVWQLVVVCLAVGLVAACLLLLPAQWRAWGKARAYRRELLQIKKLLEEERGQPDAAEPVVSDAEVSAEEPLAEDE
ncbi:MAG: DUF1049 domain-containing protein [Armatimonadetes bacterium]|nr:DUF1049 domain-containing protein [Armatimonadota bacterium]NIO74317.1 DUF1049 domain-containing protein [Armatimonadota bacterium]NIO95524.1 DUF1049 domain-containing protein [Armatimonadota bacterium]